MEESLGAGALLAVLNAGQVFPAVSLLGFPWRLSTRGTEEVTCPTAPSLQKTGVHATQREGVPFCVAWLPSTRPWAEPQTNPSSTPHFSPGHSLFLAYTHRHRLPFKQEINRGGQ